MKMKSALVIVSVLFLILTSLCSADVWTSVYYADGITPLPRLDPNMPLLDPNIPTVYVDIMVGTQLSIVVSSDAHTVRWAGELSIDDPDALRGQIWPCDYNALTYNWAESCSVLPAARSMSGRGKAPLVRYGKSSMADAHFVSMMGTKDPNIGEWFVVDYHAIGIGECRVLFEEPIPPSVPPPIFEPIPVEIRVLGEMVFTHAQTRDFDDNHVVDFSDFALMARQMQDYEDTDPNLPIDPSSFPYEYDFDQNQALDSTDLSMFMGFWLARTR